MIWRDGRGLAAVAGPVGASLGVATRVGVVVSIHVLCGDSPIGAMGVGVVGGACSRDARVYGNIRVRFHLGSVNLGSLMGSPIRQ